MLASCLINKVDIYSISFLPCSNSRNSFNSTGDYYQNDNNKTNNNNNNNK